MTRSVMFSRNTERGMIMIKSDINIGIVSLGCAKNQVDTELMLGLVAKEGYTVVNEAEQSDILIVNTCAFIESAREEAINTILEMAEYKKNGRLKGLIVAGCLAERYENEIKNEIPEADGIVGINSVGEITDAIEEILSGNSLPVVKVSDEYGTEYMNGPRILSTKPGSAYVKIAEGCDNRCSYCAIPLIRGGMRSRRMEDIIAEVKNLAEKGIKEINIIAQDTTRYGLDIYGRCSLSGLLTELDKIEGIEWIRLLYMYPDEIYGDLIDTFASMKKLVPYVDLPLQHISGSVLQRMNRRGTPEEIKNTIKRLRETLPGCIVRTSFIVGFPGETEEDFRELYDFVKEFKPERVGVFCYSSEEGTPAADMEGKVPKRTAQRRYRQLMELAASVSCEACKKREGTVTKVLTENVSDDGIFYVGRSYAEAPDADGLVYFTAPDPVEPGSMVNVRILIGEQYDVTGTLEET